MQDTGPSNREGAPSARRTSAQRAIAPRHDDMSPSKRQAANRKKILALACRRLHRAARKFCRTFACVVRPAYGRLLSIVKNAREVGLGSHKTRSNCEQRCARQGGRGGRAICKTCALSANRGLSRLASERQPLIFGSARRQRGRGGACHDAKRCGAGDSWVNEGS